jgi:hypothetical protein
MEDTQKFILIGVGLFMLAIIFSSGSVSSNKTDGVYESAMSKIDSGQALSEREQQRVSDIVNWCNRCNGPLRNCDH